MGSGKTVALLAVAVAVRLGTKSGWGKVNDLHVAMCVSCRCCTYWEHGALPPRHGAQRPSCCVLLLPPLLLLLISYILCPSCLFFICKCMQGAAKQLLELRQYSAWVTPASGVLLVSGGTYALLSRLLPSV